MEMVWVQFMQNQHDRRRNLDHSVVLADREYSAGIYSVHHPFLNGIKAPTSAVSYEEI